MFKCVRNEEKLSGADMRLVKAEFDGDLRTEEAGPLIEGRLRNQEEKYGRLLHRERQGSYYRIRFGVVVVVDGRRGRFRVDGVAGFEFEIEFGAAGFGPTYRGRCGRGGRLDNHPIMDEGSQLRDRTSSPGRCNGGRCGEVLEADLP